jgi:uncharacterized membrane protein
MVNTYTVLKTIHVLVAIVWVGGGIMIVTLLARARRANDSGGLAGLVRQLQFVGPRIFAPSGLILVITGIWMVQHQGIPWDLWVILGLVGWGATFITGNFFLRPTGEKLGETIAEKGPDDPGSLALMGRILNVARVDQVVLVLVVIDMVIKPT